MIALNDILSNHANFTPPMRFSLFTPHAAKHAGVTIAYVTKSAEFLSECGRAKCFSQSSKSNELIFNTMFFGSACLKASTRIVDRSFTSEWRAFVMKKCRISGRRAVTRNASSSAWSCNLMRSCFSTMFHSVT